MEEEEDATVLFVTDANNILHSFFSNLKVYINNQQIYNSNGLYAHHVLHFELLQGSYL